jgi:YD repeat-containing protein
VTYKLDKMGNRTSIVDTGVTKTYAPNALNQYASAEGLPVSNGNDHQVSAYDSVSYMYRNDEQLISVTSAGNNYELAYDATGPLRETDPQPGHDVLHLRW